MRYINAETVKWTPMNIKGVDGFFSDMRINNVAFTDQNGWCYAPNKYELADCSSDGDPCRYSKKILVDFYGTFISVDPLPWDEKETEYGYKPTGYINNLSEWGFTDSEMTYDEMVASLKSMVEAKQNILQEDNNNESKETSNSTGTD